MRTSLNEFPALLCALYGGLITGIVYDLFSLMRLPFSSKWIHALLDTLFYAVCFGFAAVLFVYINGGILRLYLILGFVSGVFLYRFAISSLLRDMAAKVILRMNKHRSEKAKLNGNKKATQAQDQAHI